MVCMVLLEGLPRTPRAVARQLEPGGDHVLDLAISSSRVRRWWRAAAPPASRGAGHHKSMPPMSDFERARQLRRGPARSSRPGRDQGVDAQDVALQSPGPLAARLAIFGRLARDDAVDAAEILLQRLGEAGAGGGDLFRLQADQAVDGGDGPSPARAKEWRGLPTAFRPGPRRGRRSWCGPRRALPRSESSERARMWRPSTSLPTCEVTICRWWSGPRRACSRPAPGRATVSSRPSAILRTCSPTDRSMSVRDSSDAAQILFQRTGENLAAPCASLWTWRSRRGRCLRGWRQSVRGRRAARWSCAPSSREVAQCSSTDS